MRKKIIWFTSFIFVVVLIGVSILFLFKNTPKNGLLKMNEVDITQKNVMIYSYYAELPLIEVMKNLDMKVDWIDKSIAEITYKDKKYTLNLSEVSLMEVGQDFNLLLPPPGGKRSYTVLEKELVLDSNTVKSALYQMGIKLDIDIEHKEKIVYIFDGTR